MTLVIYSLELNVDIPKPDEVVDFDAIIYDVNTHAADVAMKQFSATVATWSEKPIIEAAGRSGTSVSVYMLGERAEIWGYINDGTRSRSIEPNPASPTYKGFLAWQGNFSSKTSPNTVGSRAGGKSGAYVNKLKVYNHKIKARNWMDLIEYRVQREAEREFYRSLSRNTNVRQKVRRSVSNFFKRL